jgi:hypothetical protein
LSIGFGILELSEDANSTVKEEIENEYRSTMTVLTYLGIITVQSRNFGVSDGSGKY